MTDYQQLQLKRLRNAKRDLVRIACDLSDVYGADPICALCTRAAELSEMVQVNFTAENSQNV